MSIQPKYGTLTPEQQAIADELFGGMPIYKPERPAMNIPQITETSRPMSNIDKRALRDLAAALDGDDWHAEGNSVYGGAYDVGDNVCHDHIASCESVNGESPLADFIAAANPATVLALLDELEAMHKYAKDRDAENEGLMLTVGRLRVERGAAEKRIAELEAREVKLPEMKMLRDYLADVTMREREDILVGVRLEFFRAIEEAGVKVSAAGKGEAS